MTQKTSLTCVDLFAGCGGLSLGLKQAGFKVKLAVEKSPMAGETYFHNLVRPIKDAEEWRRYHEELTVEEQAKSGLVVRELSDVLNSKEVLSALRASEIDLVAGGPPCQGFSLAGRRNPDDARNLLPWQFLSFVEQVSPKAVIIENVSGIRQDFKKHGAVSPFDELKVALAETGVGYVVQPMLLNAMHFGAPQHRPRVFLVAVRRDLAKTVSLSATSDIWNSNLDAPGVSILQERPHLAPQRTHFGTGRGRRHLTVEDAIADLAQIHVTETTSLSKFAAEMRTDTRYIKSKKAAGHFSTPQNHVLRKHSEKVMERFKLYQFFSREGIHPKVLSIPTKVGISDAARRRLMQEAISKTRYPAKDCRGEVLAKDNRELMQLLIKLATKKHSQRALSWQRPAPTVVSLPDDYVHPSLPRIPTVRELARFQSFPDAFQFRSKETTGAHRRRIEVPQYTQVGNAVPPLLAKALGQRLRDVLVDIPKHAPLSDRVSFAVA